MRLQAGQPLRNDRVVDAQPLLDLRIEHEPMCTSKGKDFTVDLVHDPQRTDRPCCLAWMWFAESQPALGTHEADWIEEAFVGPLATPPLGSRLSRLGDGAIRERPALR